VDVETEDGRVIGRVRFRVEAETGRMLDLQTMNY
jgi:hypothetical protein